MQNRLFRSECNGFGRPRLRSSAPGNRLIWCLVPLFAFALTGCVTMPLIEDPEIDIHFVNGVGEEPLVEPASGWPLTLSLTANRDKLLGIWTSRAGVYPELGHAGALVFDDPDGCPSWVDRSWQENSLAAIQVSKVPIYPACEAPPAVPWPPDETVVPFEPGILPDPQECSAEPYLETFDCDDGSNTTPIGPCVASGAGGYGYGSNPGLPGLVVVADAGLGVVTDKDFNCPSLRARNLAGLFQSVAYELKESRGQTSILAHLNVPPKLLSPVVLVDEVFDPGGWGCDRLVRADCADQEPECPSDRSGQVVTIRAFVVNDRAPDELADLNDDGVVDIADAERAGLQLLSKQVIFRLAKPPDQQFYKDLDGNELAIRDCELPPLPPDPGSIEEPPP